MHNPYTPAHISSMEYANIEKCGLYQDDCQEWSRKPRLNKNWSNFKAHFATAFMETQRSSSTSKTKGYAANVQSAQSNAAMNNRDVAGPHHGDGKSRNSNTSQQKIGRTVDENNSGSINPCHYPHRKASNGAIIERPSKNIRTLFGPSP